MPSFLDGPSPCLTFSLFLCLTPGPCPFYGYIPQSHLLLVTAEEVVVNNGAKTGEDEEQDPLAWRIEKSLFGPRRKVRSTIVHSYTRKKKSQKCRKEAKMGDVL
jgi:hypothetical protein